MRRCPAAPRSEDRRVDFVAGRAPFRRTCLCPDGLAAATRGPEDLVMEHKDKRVQEMIARRATRQGRSIEEGEKELQAKPLADQDAEQRAERLNRTVDQVRAWDQTVLGAAPAYPLPQCLKADEIDAVVTHEPVTADREEHLASCTFCQLQVAAAQPNRAHADRVGRRMAEVVRARAAARDEARAAAGPAPAWGWMGVLSGGLVGAAGVLLIWLKIGPFPGQPDPFGSSTFHEVPPPPPAHVSLDKLATEIELTWNQKRSATDGGELAGNINVLVLTLDHAAERGVYSLNPEDQKDLQE